MSNTTDLAASKYVSVTTFTKDGTPKPVPVWVVQVEPGKIGFTTGSDSWKVKRIRNTPKVTVQPSDARGRVADGALEVTGTAEVVDGAELDRITELVKQKYKLMFPVITVFEKIRKLVKRADHGDPCGVVITLDD